MITKKLGDNLSSEEDSRVLEVSRTIGEGDIYLEESVISEMPFILNKVNF